jgi:hypothetical protein
MNKLLIVAGAVTALAVTSAPANAAPTPATSNANATARIMRPLQLTSTQDLDYGTLVMSGAGAYTQAMHIDQTGALTGCGANITCSGTAQAATYNVIGTNNQTVVVNVSSPVTLTNANDGTTLDLTPDAPATVDLGASGNAGVDFNIGGTITIDSATTTDGVYSGTFDVSVDYQ